MTDRQTSSFAQLLPYVEADTRLTDTVNGILLMVRQLVGTVSNSNMTLKNLIQGNEQIMELMNLAFNNSHDAVGLLLNAPFRNPGKLIEIFVSKDPFEYLCNHNSSEIQEVFSIPSNVDAERVHSVICSANETILEELYSLSGWTRLESELQNTTSVTWEQIFQNFEGLSKDIANLIENVPKNFEDGNNVSPLEVIISRFYQDLTINGEEDIYELIGALNSLLSSIYGNAVDDTLRIYFEMFQVYINYANDILSKISTKNRELHLGSLFENTTAWKNTMQFVFGLQENMIEAFLGSTIRIEKVTKVEIITVVKI